MAGRPKPTHMLLFQPSPKLSVCAIMHDAPALIQWDVGPYGEPPESEKPSEQVTCHPTSTG